jgi:hypothetical protein
MARDRSSLAPPELRLVLLAACGEWSDEGMCELLERDLDWPSVLGVAMWEQATSVLLRRIEALGRKEAIPSRERGDLERAAAVEDFRMSLLEGRLHELLAVLHENDVDVVLLKGAGIALRWYGGLAARPMGDLDLLVRAEEGPRAQRLACRLGWVERAGLVPEMYADMQHLLPLEAADGLGFGVEIHTDLFPGWSPFKFSAADVWERAIPLSGPIAARVPAPEHQLLHACVHFAWSHCFRRGSWRAVRDIDALLDRGGIEPSSFAALAREARGATCVFWTLALVRALTGRDVPDEMMEGLGVAPMPLLSQILLRHLVAEALPGGAIPGTRTLGRTLWSLAIRPGKSGHDGVRPWTASDRWPHVDEIPVVPREARGNWTHRVRGLLGYSRQLTGSRWPSG